MISQTATHSTLLARVAGGADPAAWADFLARYGDLIESFGRRRGLQPADIDDVRQDVLLALTRAMPGFEYDPAKGKFRAYLKTVVVRAIARRACQNSGRARLEDIEEMSRIANSDADVEEAWEDAWRQYHLRTAMRCIESEFSEKDRAAFDQYAVLGREVRDVAVSLALSVDQVYQAKSRILKRLTALIEQQIAEEG